MYYLIIPDALAYPKDVEIPYVAIAFSTNDDGKVKPTLTPIINVHAETDSSEFKNPRSVIQQKLDRLIASRMVLNVYADLSSALKAYATSPEYLPGILCLPHSAVHPITETPNATGELLVKLEDPSALKLGIAHFCYERDKTERHVRAESCDILFYDDYAALWQVIRRIEETDTSDIALFDERELIAHCNRLDVSAMSTLVSYMKILHMDISSFPLATLFIRPTPATDIPKLKTAIVVMLMQGGHQCVYNNSVFESLYAQTHSVQGSWLPAFFKKLVEIIQTGHFKSNHYSMFFKHALHGNFEACDKILDHVFAKFDKAKIARLDVALEKELKSAFAFLALTDKETCAIRSIASTHSMESTEGGTTPRSDGHHSDASEPLSTGIAP